MRQLSIGLVLASCLISGCSGGGGIGVPDGGTKDASMEPPPCVVGERSCDPRTGAWRICMGESYQGGFCDEGLVCRGAGECVSEADAGCEDDSCPECTVGECISGDEVCTDGTLMGSESCADELVCGHAEGDDSASCVTTSFDRLSQLGSGATSSPVRTRQNLLRMTENRLLVRFGMPGITGDVTWTIYEAISAAPIDEWTDFTLLSSSRSAGEPDTTVDLNVMLQAGRYYLLGADPIDNIGTGPQSLEQNLPFAEVLGYVSGAKGSPDHVDETDELRINNPDFGGIGDTESMFNMTLVTTAPCSGPSCITRPSELGVSCDNHWDCTSNRCETALDGDTEKVCVVDETDFCDPLGTECAYVTESGQESHCIGETLDARCFIGCSTDEECPEFRNCAEVYVGEATCSSVVGRVCLPTCSGSENECDIGSECGGGGTACVPNGTDVRVIGIHAPLC